MVIKFIACSSHKEKVLKIKILRFCGSVGNGEPLRAAMEEQQNWSGIFQVSWMPGREGAER